MDEVFQEILTRYKTGEGNFISFLKDLQNAYVYLSPGLMNKVAEGWGIPVGKAFEVATFYSFLSTKPLGKNVIRVCKSLPCYLKGSQTIIETAEKELGIKPSETTEDKRFSLQLTNCIAPAMMINDKTYGDLTPKKIAEILKECR